MAGYLSGEDIEEIADYQRCKAELTRLRSDLEKAIEALREAVRGWEALPGNQNHSPFVIERWLGNEMVGAINHIRSTLSQLENSK